MSTARLQLAFDGEAVRSGSMDVHDLAPAMLAAGDLVKTCNRLLNGDRANVSLRVESDFKTGSFELALILDQGLIETAKTLFTGQDGVLNAAALVKLVFGVGTAATSGTFGIFKLMQALKGQKPISIITNGDNNTVIINAGDGNALEGVDKTTAELYGNDDVRRNARRMLKPLKRPGMEYLEVRDGGKAVERITKDDASEILASEDEQYREIDVQADQSGVSRRETVLRIVKPTFRRGNKYLVTEGETEFYATIEDQNFLDDVDCDRIRFSCHGRLRVTLRQEITPGEKHDTVAHFVEEVIKYEVPEPTRQLTIADSQN